MLLALVQFLLDLSLTNGLFFGFLLRLRHNQRMSARKLDRELWSAADYAVMITGLDQGVAADDTSEGKGDGLESRVYADLARLGYDKERIVQVEVGRECREEVDTITALGQIKVREQELLSKVKRAEASRRKPSLVVVQHRAQLGPLRHRPSGLQPHLERSAGPYLRRSALYLPLLDGRDRRGA